MNKELSTDPFGFKEHSTNEPSFIRRLRSYDPIEVKTLSSEVSMN